MPWNRPQFMICIGFSRTNSPSSRSNHQLQFSTHPQRSMAKVKLIQIVVRSSTFFIKPLHTKCLGSMGLSFSKLAHFPKRIQLCRSRVPVIFGPSGELTMGPIPLICLVWHKDANSPLHFHFLAPSSISNPQYSLGQNK